MSEGKNMPQKHAGGRPKELATLLAEKYGVKARAIKLIGVERFAAVSDDARRSRLSVSHAGFHGKLGGHPVCEAESEASGSSEAFEDAVRERGCYHGRTIAEWVEEFGRSTLERVKRTTRPAIDEGSDELISKVDRMVDLARRAA